MYVVSLKLSLDVITAEVGYPVSQAIAQAILILSSVQVSVKKLLF
jgi:hypothetical protein|tara:strand:- start:541 stop:675 length:135 start_codon:yes stop_codon:yes gene_type:complete